MSSHHEMQNPNSFSPRFSHNCWDHHQFQHNFPGISCRIKQKMMESSFSSSSSYSSSSSQLLNGEAAVSEESGWATFQNRKRQKREAKKLEKEQALQKAAEEEEKNGESAASSSSSAASNHGGGEGSNAQFPSAADSNSSNSNKKGGSGGSNSAAAKKQNIDFFDKMISVISVCFWGGLLLLLFSSFPCSPLPSCPVLLALPFSCLDGLSLFFVELRFVSHFLYAPFRFALFVLPVALSNLLSDSLPFLSSAFFSIPFFFR